MNNSLEEVENENEFCSSIMRFMYLLQNHYSDPNKRNEIFSVYDEVNIIKLEEEKMKIMIEEEKLKENEMEIE